MKNLVTLIPAKSRMFIAMLFLLCTGIVLGLIFVLTPDPSRMPKSIHWELNNHKEFGEEELVFYPALWEFMKTRDPKTDRIPASIRGKELSFAAKLPRKPELTKSQNWVSNGPSNFSGRLLSVAMDIEDENVMLAAAASGGVWRTEDAGVLPI